MLPYLNNEQRMQLKRALTETLQGATIEYEDGIKADERDAVSAKRIEGCSEKTLGYHQKTIETMISGIGKAAQQITTDELRRYLTNYQMQRGSSRITIDNIRRILNMIFYEKTLPSPLRISICAAEHWQKLPPSQVSPNVIVLLTQDFTRGQSLP